MGIKLFDVMDLGKANLINPEQLGYMDSLGIIKDESYKIQKSFVKVGWYLKHIRDNELYKEGGYKNMWECADEQLGYSQPTAWKLIRICEMFSKDHNSWELDEKYAGFSKSQMIEMLSLEPEQIDNITPDMSVRQIREIKDKKPGGKIDPVADDNIPGQTSLEKDFPEYMPEEQSEESKGAYATSHKEVYGQMQDWEGHDNYECEGKIIDGNYREINDPEPEEENIATSQPPVEERAHDESWFVEQYVKIMPDEAAKLFEICRQEENNSDRANSIQKYLAPYGSNYVGCAEWAFDFHVFSAGMDFEVGDEKIHMKYGRLVVELMKIMEEEAATSQPDDSDVHSLEERSAYGLEKTEYPEGSLLTTAGCGHKYDCFSCAQECGIRQKKRYCRTAPFGNPFECDTMGILENLKMEVGDRCQFVNNDLAYHTAGSGEADPCCRECKESCEYRCQRAYQNEVIETRDGSGMIPEAVPYGSVTDEFAELKRILEKENHLLEDYLEVGNLPELTVFRQKTIVTALASMVCDLENATTDQETEPQPELPVLKNNDQRKKWLADYKAWGLWYRDENIDVNYYKYDFTDGSRLVVAEYPQRRTYYYSSEYKDEHYYHLLEKNKKGYKKPYDELYRQQTDSESYLVEFLKNLQKNGKLN